jgi:hypothetical protein
LKKRTKKLLRLRSPASVGAKVFASFFKKKFFLPYWFIRAASTGCSTRLSNPMAMAVTPVIEAIMMKYEPLLMLSHQVPK